MPRLVAEADHDAFGIFEVVRVLLLVGVEALVGQVEGKPDERDAVRTAPFVRHVTRRTEADALALQLGIELLDERPERAAGKLQPHLIDALTPQFGGGRLNQLAHGLDDARGVGSAQADGRSKITEPMPSEWRLCHDQG
jgi:hypothetical protein